jgi:hypothetical protein
MEKALRGKRIAFRTYNNLVLPEVANSPSPIIGLPKKSSSTYTPKKSKAIKH